MDFKRWAPLATVLAFLTLSACSATKARINDNEDLFNTYPPEVQAQIKSNRIDNGFDKTQVYLALGNADRTDAAEGQEVWYYHCTEKDSLREEKSANEYREDMDRYNEGVKQGRKLTEPSTYRTVQLYRARVLREVHFENGTVSSWSEPDEQWLEEWHR